MPTSLPPYRNAQGSVPNEDQPQDEFMWDVRAEADNESGEDSPPSSGAELRASPEPSFTSELLERFPRPRASANRTPEPRRLEIGRRVVAGVLFVASAAAAAWFVVA